MMLSFKRIFTGLSRRLRFSFLNPEGQLQFSRSSTYLREKIFFKIFFFNFLAKSWHFKPILVKKKFQNFFKIFLSSKTAVRHNHSTKFKSNNWNCWSFTGTNFPPKEKFLSQKLWLWEVLKVGRDIFWDQQSWEGHFWDQQGLRNFWKCWNNFFLRSVWKLKLRQIRQL